ncbi:hypothetical protein BDV18DRAFT_128430 [Aspergillus unguis]
MGWVGAITVIATTCFLLYRHPPTSWFPEPPAADQARSESTSEEKESVGSCAPKEQGHSSIESESQQATAKDKPVEDSQGTPKASPSSAPVLDVPAFQLNGDSEMENKPVQKAQEDTEPQTTSPPSPQVPAPSNSMPNIDSNLTKQPVANNAASLMPPPPRPTPSTSRQQPPTLRAQPRPQPQGSLAPPAGRFPPRPSNGTSSSLLSPPPSAASSLRVPPGSRPGSNNSLSPTPVTLKPAKKASQRAVLDPGFSPLDWAALTSNPNHKLRGANLPPGLIKVTPSMLKAQHGRKGVDAWTSYQGKVYNITPYLPFHPGGKGELLRGAGKDSGKLFLEIHPWVNWDAILGECLVGILVSENEAAEENKLDAMD